MVKSLRMPRGAWFAPIVALLLAQAGCAAQTMGIVHPAAPRGVVLDTPQGERYRLGLPRDAHPMRWLDGHLVEVEGTRIFKHLRVEGWSVLEGRHGLPVWVGPIEVRGSQVGMQDRNSGSFVFLDERAVPVLSPHAGRVVLVEGYVEGAHRIRVVYFRILADTEESP